MAEFIRIGNDGGGGSGIRVVAPNGDIDDPDFGDLVLDTEHPTIRVVQSGAVQIATRGVGIDVVIPDQGFIPYVLAAMYTEEYIWHMGQWQSGTILSPPEVFYANGRVPSIGGPVWNGSQMVSLDGGETGSTSAPGTNTFYSIPWQDGARYNRCIMPYMAYDDRDRGITRGREVGYFNVIAEQAKLTITSWSAPGGQPYFVKYAVLGVPIA